jgi:hypothetical protein
MQISAKQRDGLLLISSASMGQTEIDISVNDKEESTMEINRVGVDLAKIIFNYMVLTAETKRSGRGTCPEVNG